MKGLAVAFHWFPGVVLGRPVRTTWARGKERAQEPPARWDRPVRRSSLALSVRHHSPVWWRRTRRAVLERVGPVASRPCVRRGVGAGTGARGHLGSGCSSQPGSRTVCSLRFFLAKRVEDYGRRTNLDGVQLGKAGCGDAQDGRLCPKRIEPVAEQTVQRVAGPVAISCRARSPWESLPWRV